MIQDTVRDKFDAVRGLGADDVLAAFGLERRRSALDVMLPAAGMFFAGLMIGAGVAFLVAPKSGRETRRALGGKASELSHRLTSAAGGVAQGVRENVFGSEERSRRQPDDGGNPERRMGEAHRPPPHAPNPHAGPQK